MPTTNATAKAKKSTEKKPTKKPALSAWDLAIRAVERTMRAADKARKAHSEAVAKLKATPRK